MLSRLSPYWLWLLLAIPAFGILSDVLTSTDPKALKHALHPSGEFAARFMIVSMMATPLAMLFKGRSFPIWLKKNRRYFGVAAFGYAALHLVFYVLKEGSLAKILSEATEFDIFTGWLAFLIFLPLAATSFDAAVLTLLHWAAKDGWEGLPPALVNFAPLALLEGYRIWYWYIRPKPARTA